MKKIIQYVLIVVAVVPLPFACNDYPEPAVCPDTRYDIDDFHTARLNGSAQHSTDTIDVNSLTIAFIFDVSKTPTAELDAPSTKRSYFIPAARALSCIGPHGTERVEIISLTSNQDFNETLVAGDDLRSQFTSVYNGSETLNELYVEVTGHYDPAEALEGYTSIELLDFPTKGEGHVFTIELQLSEGRTYTVTTAPIRFN